VQGPHRGDPPRLPHALIRRYSPPTQHHRLNVRRSGYTRLHPQTNALLLSLARGCTDVDFRGPKHGYSVSNHTVQNWTNQNARKHVGLAARDQGGERNRAERRWEAESQERGKGREIRAGAGEKNLRGGIRVPQFLDFLGVKKFQDETHLTNALVLTLVLMLMLNHPPSLTLYIP
jgi:hypothetical protein